MCEYESAVEIRLYNDETGEVAVKQLTESDWIIVQALFKDLEWVPVDKEVSEEQCIDRIEH